MPGLAEVPERPSPSLSGAQEHILVVPGDPVPWAPKATNRETGSRFVPGRQSHAIGQIMLAWESLQVEGLGSSAQVQIDCTFFCRRPKGHFGTGRNERIIKPRFRDARPSGRPDLSNLVKLVEDALTKVAWHDDDQVVKIVAEKWYTTGRDEHPRSVIRIRSL